MHRAVRVGVVERLTHGADETHRRVKGDHIVMQLAIQRFTVDKLGDQIVQAVCLTEIIQRRQVGMA